MGTSTSAPAVSTSRKRRYKDDEEVTQTIEEIEKRLKYIRCLCRSAKDSLKDVDLDHALETYEKALALINDPTDTLYVDLTNIIGLLSTVKAYRMLTQPKTNHKLILHYQKKAELGLSNLGYSCDALLSPFINGARYVNNNPKSHILRLPRPKNQPMYNHLPSAILDELGLFKRACYVHESVLLYVQLVFIIVAMETPRRRRGGWASLSRSKDALLKVLLQNFRDVVADIDRYNTGGTYYCIHNELHVYKALSYRLLGHAQSACALPAHFSYRRAQELCPRLEEISPRLVPDNRVSSAS